MQGTSYTPSKHPYRRPQLKHLIRGEGMYGSGRILFGDVYEYAYLHAHTHMRCKYGHTAHL